MLNKSELTQEIASRLDGFSPAHVRQVLDELAAVGAQQVGAGEDFTVPGLVKIAWAYTSPRRKGELYRKGDTYTGFGGVEQVATEDSKARSASVKLRISPLGAVAKARPKKDGMSKFLSGKVGRSIIAQKG